MGGTISIAARFNDGQAVCVDGWTNFIPRMVVNATTLSGDDRIVRETLLEVATHGNYEGPQPFRASGYGMVAVDFVGRAIHSMQGYTSFVRKMVGQLGDLNGSGWKDGVFVNVVSEEGGGLLDAGRVLHVATNRVELPEPVILTREAVIAMLDNETHRLLEGGNRDFHELRIDTAPFVVHEYPEGGSLSAMKERLRAAGFPLTRKEGLNSMFKQKTPAGARA